MRPSMPDEGSELKELSKVAHTYIDNVAKTVGTGNGTTYVTERAKTRARAVVIEAQAREEITDRQRRAIARRRYEDEREQANLEAITRAAIPHLSDQAKPEQIDDDWLADFFDRAKKVSDKDMRTLWAEILAGQANAQGSFHKNALHTVSLLEKEDAHLFVKVCSFVFDIREATPVIFNLTAELYLNNGLHFDALSHLDDIGLVKFSNIGFSKTQLPPKLPIIYHGRTYIVSLPGGQKELPCGHVTFTAVGRRLAPL